MKKLILFAAVMTLGIAGTAFAGATVGAKDPAQITQEQDMHRRFDHPKTQVVKSELVKIDITKDMIMHSCCMPPNLVVAGKVTNVTSGPLDFVHLNFAFEDKNGKILHAEGLYNHKAETLNDDPSIQKILNEKPHFVPLAPGETDTFAFSIPCPDLPEFSKVELYASNTR
jgi:hypothetical protein